MALFQANLVRDRLAAAHPELAESGMIEIIVIRTTGDRVQNRLLAEIGGKGLFTKEIEEALIARRIDLAVHSLKDMETALPPGLDIVCVLKRDDPRDVLVARGGAGLAALPAGAKIGTASLRRRAQLLRRRPDLAIAPIRGNVDTRLDKLAGGEVDGLLLALCGLQRRGRAISSSANASRRCTTRRAPPASPPSGRCWRRSTARAAPRSPDWPNSTATASASGRCCSPPTAAPSGAPTAASSIALRPRRSPVSYTHLT